MKTWLASLIAFVVLTVASIGLAVHEDGGGGGSVYTKRSPEELRQLLQDYRLRREALRRTITAPAPPASPGQAALSEEQEMLHLQQLAFEAQAAQLRANRFVRAR